MMEVIFYVGNIAGGILLGIASLDKLDGNSDFFNKIANYLAPFDTIIGGGMLALGIMNLLSGNGLLFNIVSCLGGLLLLTQVLVKIPAIGDSLTNISYKLMPFKVSIGLYCLVFGIFRLFF